MKWIQIYMQNKNVKLKYIFYCSDTHHKATGIYLKDIEKFEQWLEDHIEYNDRSFLWRDKYIKNKYDNNDFKENDFLDKKNLKIKNLGLYFKCLFMSNFNISPTKAKIMFKKNF